MRLLNKDLVSDILFEEQQKQLLTKLLMFIKGSDIIYFCLFDFFKKKR